MKTTKNCLPVRVVWDDFSTLGRRQGVQVAPESQAVGSYTELWRSKTRPEDLEKVGLIPQDDESISSLLVGTKYALEEKDQAVGRALDGVVEVAGTRWFFGGVLTVITGWAIAGGVFGAPDLWQIVFQDASSIQCYLSDMILMRQQMNDFREHLRIIALLRSRSYTIANCFRLLIKQGRLEPAKRSPLYPSRFTTSSIISERELERLSVPAIEQTEFQKQASRNNKKKSSSSIFDDLEGAASELDEVGDAHKLAPEDFLDRVIIVIADVMGSIWVLAAFVISMVVWISLGPLYDFQNSWQLWLNTCTALQQTLYTCLLTLARNRHSHFVEGCMSAIFRQECELEYRARALTGYSTPNEEVRIEWTTQNRFERGLDWYAAFIGSGYGAIFSVFFFAAWLGVGHPMSWGDNWWLIVGTWTGVVGTFNAAVLRYSLFKEEERIGSEYAILTQQDKAIFMELALPCPERRAPTFKPNLMTQISIFISRMCATPWAVLAVLTLIVGLLIGATAALWDETTQLLVNSVTMIVESFFLIVLIKAHNMQATEHRVRLHDLLSRRLQLLVIQNRVEAEVMASELSGAPCFL